MIFQTEFGGSWRKTSNRREGDTLTLSEVVVLRRIRDGASQTETARALGWPDATVNGLVRKVRIRFNVSTNRDLLALPRVVEQLTEGGAA